jgi:hypothetical protein
MTAHPALEQGEQTIITPFVQDTANKAKEYVLSHGKIEGIHPNLITAYFTSEFIKKELPELDESKLKEPDFFRKRTLNDILEQGYYPSCSDKGLLFRGLMIAQGIPTLYLESFHEEYLLGSKNKIHGHVFGRVFYDEKSTIFDPTAMQRFSSEQDLFSKERYVIVGEGLDSWSLGIRGIGDMKRIRESKFSEISGKYKQLLRIDYLQKNKKINEIKRKLS